MFWAELLFSLHQFPIITVTFREKHGPILNCLAMYVYRISKLTYITQVESYIASVRYPEYSTLHTIDGSDIIKRAWTTSMTGHRNVYQLFCAINWTYPWMSIFITPTCRRVVADEP